MSDVSTIYISIGLVLLARSFNALMDTLAHRHSSSIFKNTKPTSFFGKNSWMRKYKEYNFKKGPRFPGSTTFLVFLTDGWHLFQLLMFLSFQTAIAIHLPYPIYFILIAEFAGGLTFQLFYNKILTNGKKGKK